jgi:hypothetical protein
MSAVACIGGQAAATCERDDSTVNIWDVAKGELVATPVSLENGKWLVLTPQGFFAASSPRVREAMSNPKLHEHLSLLVVLRFRAFAKGPAAMGCEY